MQRLIPNAEGIEIGDGRLPVNLAEEGVVVRFGQLL